MTSSPPPGAAPPSFWSSPRALPVAAAVLATLGWLVFNPALNRVFAGDHLWYFAEVGGRSSLSAGLHFLDYSASRVYWRGDDVTFRPLLFAWMAIANALFSYHHVWWNAANLAIHVTIGVVIFRLLAAIRPSAFALVGAALFIVLTPPIELVLWNHLGGYLLAWLCLAFGLHAFAVLTGATTSLQPLASSPRPPTSDLSRAATAFVAAFASGAFFYEALAPIGALLAAIVIWRDRGAGRFRIERAALLLSPMMLFTLLYVWHASRVPRMGYIHGAIVRAPESRLLDTLPLAFRAARHWFWEIAMPTTVTLSSHAFERFMIGVATQPSSERQWLNLLTVVAGLALIARVTSARRIRQTWSFLFGLVLAAAVYVGVLAFGRPPQDLFEATYYPYVFGMLTVVFLYALVDSERLTPVTRAAGVVVAIALFAFHLETTMKVVDGVYAANRYQSRYWSKLIAFVDAHKNEPDFTFAIERHPESLDPQVTLIRGYPDDPKPAVESRRASEILFASYYRPADPKYLLDASAVRVVSGTRLP